MKFKVYVPVVSSGLSGGFQFVNNFKKGAEKTGLIEIVNNFQDSDIVLITGVTVIDREEIQKAKSAGKKIVLRIDNMPKDSRNRGTAFSKMSDIAKIADYIVFQSEWARDYVGWWLKDTVKANAMDDKIWNCRVFNVETKKFYEGRNSVIYNGVDTEIFNYSDNPKERPEVYLFSAYNRDENKRFPEAAYYFHTEVFRKNNKAILYLMGQFSPELQKYNFDFFAGENIVYQGVIEDRKEISRIMRKCKYLLVPFYADASPNTISEAMACGLEILMMNPVGGSVEVYNKNLKNIYSIEEMLKDYHKIFSLLIN